MFYEIKRMFYFYSIIDNNQEYLANNLKTSLSKFDLDLTILSIYNKEIGNVSKLTEFLKYIELQTYTDSDFIILLDAFDVLVMNSPIEPITKYFTTHPDTDILFSAENTNGMNFTDTKEYYESYSTISESRNIFINSGVIIGRAKKYIEFLRQIVSEIPSLHSIFKISIFLKDYLKSDQALIRYFVKYHDMLNTTSCVRIDIDRYNSITYTDTTENAINYNQKNYVFNHTWGIQSISTPYRFIQLSKYHKYLKSLNIYPTFKTKIVFISLENNYYRLENIARQMTNLLDRYPGIKWSINKAVDGSSIQKNLLEFGIYNINYNSEIYYYDSTKRPNRSEMTNNEIACSLSHYKAYIDLVNDENYNNYIIFEDDVVLSNIDELCSQLYILDNESKCQFDVALLSYSLFQPLQRIRVINECFSEIKKQNFNNSSAYVLTKSGAMKLLSFIQGVIKYPSDDTLATMFLNDNLNIVASNELIAKYDKTLQSTLT